MSPPDARGTRFWALVMTEGKSHMSCQTDIDLTLYHPWSVILCEHPEDPHDGPPPATYPQDGYPN